MKIPDESSFNSDDAKLLNLDNEKLQKDLKKLLIFGTPRKDSSGHCKEIKHQMRDKEYNMGSEILTAIPNWFSSITQIETNCSAAGKRLFFEYCRNNNIDVDGLIEDLMTLNAFAIRQNQAEFIKQKEKVKMLVLKKDLPSEIKMEAISLYDKIIEKHSNRTEKLLHECYSSEPNSVNSE